MPGTPPTVQCRVHLLVMFPGGTAPRDVPGGTAPRDVPGSNTAVDVPGSNTAVDVPGRYSSHAVPGRYSSHAVPGRLLLVMSRVGCGNQRSDGGRVHSGTPGDTHKLLEA